MSDMQRMMIIEMGWFLLLMVCASLASAAEPEGTLPPGLRERIVAQFAGRTPHAWSERVKGVRTRLKSSDNVMALTLDACGGGHGSGFDAALIHFLEKEAIPATLFVNSRWIDANPELFRRLSDNPLFEIANHGLMHRPATISGRSIYGIAGTRNAAELVDEIEGNADKISRLTGKRPRYYRSGTAYYDEVAVEISCSLGQEVVGFSILGDAGATYRRDQVKSTAGCQARRHSPAAHEPSRRRNRSRCDGSGAGTETARDALCQAVRI